MKKLLHKIILVLFTLLISSSIFAGEITILLLCPSSVPMGSRVAIKPPMVNGQNNQEQMPWGVVAYLQDGSAPPVRQFVSNTPGAGTITVPDTWLNKVIIIETTGMEKDGYCAPYDDQSKRKYKSNPTLLTRDHQNITMHLR